MQLVLVYIACEGSGFDDALSGCAAYLRASLKGGLLTAITGSRLTISTISISVATSVVVSVSRSVVVGRGVIRRRLLLRRFTVRLSCCGLLHLRIGNGLLLALGLRLGLRLTVCSWLVGSGSRLRHGSLHHRGVVIHAIFE